MTLLTLQEAAAHLRVSVRTVEREAADGRIAIVRVRRRRMVEPAEIARYVAAQREKPCQSASTGTDGKFDLGWVADAVLSARSRQEPTKPTRSRSKVRSAARRSTLRLVGSRT